MTPDWKIWHLFTNRVLVSALAAQMSAQIIKVFLPLAKGKPPDFRAFFHYGGMPSGHTAFLAGASAAIGLWAGWGSPLFALAAVVAAILIYDILKLRRAVEMSLKGVRELQSRGVLPKAPEPPQFRAHTPLEVIIGGLWGAGWAALIGWLWK